MYKIVFFYSTGLPFTPGTQGNSGYFKILKSLRVTQDILNFFLSL